MISVKDILQTQGKSAGTADYDFLLELPATVSMPTTGDKTQIIHKFDDGNISVASLSDDSYFEVEIMHDVLTEDDAGVLLDLWHDPSKANGRERTFYWENTDDSNVYVVRFMDVVRKVSEHKLGEYTSIDRYILRIETWTHYYGS
jgi:hypothetical protein